VSFYLLVVWNRLSLKICITVALSHFRACCLPQCELRSDYIPTGALARFGRIYMIVDAWKSAVSWREHMSIWWQDVHSEVSWESEFGHLHHVPWVVWHPNTRLMASVSWAQRSDWAPAKMFKYDWCEVISAKYNRSEIYPKPNELSLAITSEYMGITWFLNAPPRMPHFYFDSLVDSARCLVYFSEVWPVFA